MGSEPIGAVLARAIQSFGDLTSLPVESISRVERADDGWQVNFEVVEVERVPRLTDLLASYEVDVDRSGNLLAWRRMRRYVRKQQEDA
jgi:Gas vesicle synthesis protein GvpO